MIESDVKHFILFESGEPEAERYPETAPRTLALSTASVRMSIA